MAQSEKTTALITKEAWLPYKANEVFSVNEAIAQKVLDKFPTKVRLYDPSKDSDQLAIHTPGNNVSDTFVYTGAEPATQTAMDALEHGNDNKGNKNQG